MEPVFFHPIRADQATASQTSAISSCTMWGPEPGFWGVSNTHRSRDTRREARSPVMGEAARSEEKGGLREEDGCKMAPKTNVSLIQGLRPDAPTPGSVGPGPGHRLRQAALPALSPGRHPPALPSWTTGAEEAETKKGEERDPLMGGACSSPPPPAGEWGLDGTEGTAADRKRHQGRVTQRNPSSHRPPDPETQREKERVC